MTNWSDYFYYDETSPSCLRWKVTKICGKGKGRPAVSAGDVAGCLGNKNRWRVTINRKSYLVHRIIWELHNGIIKDNMVIDHMNRDPTDNRLANLREISFRENLLNQRKRSTNTSGWTGVSFITHGGRLYCTATIMQKSGTAKVVWFSVKKLGIIPATRMAILCRRVMIEELREAGLPYTDQHGT